MLYTALIFGDPGVFGRLSPEEQEIAMDKHRALQQALKEKGVYRGSIRLMSPSTAMQVTEKAEKPLVLDGPFAETKEQILGLYAFEAKDMDEALEIAGQLPLNVATMEVRPVHWGEFVPET